MCYIIYKRRLLAPRLLTAFLRVERRAPPLVGVLLDEEEAGSSEAGASLEDDPHELEEEDVLFVAAVFVATVSGTTDAPLEFVIAGVAASAGPVPSAAAAAAAVPTAAAPTPAAVPTAAVPSTELEAPLPIPEVIICEPLPACCASNTPRAILAIYFSKL